MRLNLLEPLVAMACGVALASCTTLEPDRVLSVTGMVDALQSTDEGLTFNLYESSLRIEMGAEGTSVESRKQLEAIAEAARTVTVRVSLRSGRIDNDLTKVVLKAHSLESIDGQFQWGDPHWQPKPIESGSGAGTIDRSLVDGITLATAGKQQDALDALNTVLSSAELSTPWRMVALRLRSNALQNYVYNEFKRPTPVGDRELVRALADTQEWASRASNESDAFYEIAAVLRELGAYEEAVTTYEYIAKRWADEDHWSSIRIGAVERQRRHYRNALEILDSYAKRADSPLGMAFHYHRGWTMGLLGRHEEAIVELSTGLKDQPDFAWAYVRRSCNLAQMGRIPEALADQRSAVALLEKFPGSGTGIRADLKHALEVQIELESQVTAGTSTPAPIGCSGYWRDEDVPRERSSHIPSQREYLATLEPKVRA
jgi:tetratricopeptide (TPR) repeat protein